MAKAQQTEEARIDTLVQEWINKIREADPMSSAYMDLEAELYADAHPPHAGKGANQQLIAAAAQAIGITPDQLKAWYKRQEHELRAL